MAMKRFMLLAGVATLAFSITAALAQDKDKDKDKAKPRTAASIECSKQADAKNLHGQARRDFRSKCKRDLAKADKAKK
jgi:psiF repeat